MEKEQPVTIEVTNYDEETGVISFDADAEAQQKLVEMGFNYAMMLGLLELNENEVFGILKDHKDRQKLKETLEQSYDYWHEGSPV